MNFINLLKINFSKIKLKMDKGEMGQSFPMLVYRPFLSIGITLAITVKLSGTIPVVKETLNKVNNSLSYKCILKYIYYTSAHGKGCTSCVISEYYFALKYKIS